jgi:hypothetical protein
MSGDFPFAPPEPVQVTQITTSYIPPPPESTNIQTGAFSGPLEKKIIPSIFTEEIHTDIPEFIHNEEDSFVMDDIVMDNIITDPDINVEIFDEVFTEINSEQIIENKQETQVYRGIEDDIPNVGKSIIKEEFTIKQPIKYTITDLFWLMNPKFNSANKPMAQEADFVTIQFNTTFGNLRVTMYKINENSINGNVVFLESMTKLKTGVIYPSSAMNIIKSPMVNIMCMEQLYKRNIEEDWQINRPICYIQKGCVPGDESIRCIISEKTTNADYCYYDFNDWQKESFLHSCQYSITTGMQIYNQYQLTK